MYVYSRSRGVCGQFSLALFELNSILILTLSTGIPAVFALKTASKILMHCTDLVAFFLSNVCGACVVKSQCSIGLINGAKL